MISTQAPIEYPAVKHFKANQLPDLYKSALKILALKSDDFPIDETSIFLEKRNNQYSLKFVRGDRVIALEKNDDINFVIRELFDGVSGTEEIVTHDGIHVISKIRALANGQNTVENVAFGEPILNETGQADYCQRKMQELSVLLILARDAFAGKLIENNNGLFIFQGDRYPDLVNSFVKAFALNVREYSPEQTTLEFRMHDGSVEVARAVTEDFSANIEVDMSDDSFLRLSWQQTNAKVDGGSAFLYSLNDNTLIQSSGRFVAENSVAYFEQTASDTAQKISDLSETRGQQARDIHRVMLDLVRRELAL